MLNIAIDGPSGAGKSTISKLLAKKLGIIYLDTGAMYRAVALYVHRKGIDVNDREKVVPLLGEIQIEFRGDGDEKKIYLNGEDVSSAIREHSVSKMASDVSKIKEVRLFLVEQQRAIAKKNDVVLDGRDITSFVLPDSKYKFFLTATAEERAKRRYEELKAKGSDISYEKILADVNDRDYNDTHRDFAPLVQTDDAVLIDSTNMTTDEVIEVILRYVNTH